MSSHIAQHSYSYLLIDLGQVGIYLVRIIK